MSNSITAVIDALGSQFGALDNDPLKWASQAGLLAGCFPQISAALADEFPQNPAPLSIFAEAQQTYERLLSCLAPPAELARGYLVLRFYILLNGFLAACCEALEKAAFNPDMDPARWVQKSDYAPYFFERATLSTPEVRRMLADEIQQLESARRDQTGILLANRIRKGTAAALSENYCPRHPDVYPPVAALAHIRISTDPAMIDTVLSCLRQIRLALE